MKYKSMLEEELKNTVARDYFGKYDCTKILSKIDFSVCLPGGGVYGDQFFLWAEAKAVKSDVYDMLTQLVLTIGKARTYNELLPPPFLGCFDIQNIVFVPYSEIQDIFYINDFNWNVAPSDKTTKEFALVKQKIIKIVEGDSGHPKTNEDGSIAAVSYYFDFEKNDKELRAFIKANFVLGKLAINKYRIDKNNFIIIYNKWLAKVKPTITVDWEGVKEAGILDCDFYLADLISRDNTSLKEMLFVYLEQTKYILDKHVNVRTGLFTSSTADFTDHQKAHQEFWSIYERPPLEEYWDYIIDRRDLLVPQDVRERKGSFYTPQIWVELSQKYMADVFGIDWQDEYYIWDCCAGTGNLLVGLTMKSTKIWASTLDKADVDVMHDRINNGVNLLPAHVFQFDFLNDSFEKLPPRLKAIIKDTPEKLIIYINPPYAEAAQYGSSKSGVSSTKVYSQYKSAISFAVNELYAQFLIQIYKEIPKCKIANFSTLKALCASNFTKFRSVFQAKLERLFIVPANTFDNVSGHFPIGFHIWDTAKKEGFKQITANVYDKNGGLLGQKTVFATNKGNVINDWLRRYYDKTNIIGYLRFVGPDFQAKRGVYLTSAPKESDIKESRIQTITEKNLIVMCIYFAVRKVIPATWLNDRDQLLYPNNAWQQDIEFQNDCLVYTLFHRDSNISSKHGINHWIPFTEQEVKAQDEYDSHFMIDFISGKSNIISFGNQPITQTGLRFSEKSSDSISRSHTPIVCSDLSIAVFDAGRKLWQYYHKQKDCNVNASFYDIREYFQGRNEAGRMNSKSNDEMYNKLLGELRQAMKLLGEQIKPKVTEYGFLL